MGKTIFITGASTGLGRLTALYFAKQGWNVAATMRSPEKKAGAPGKEEAGVPEKMGVGVPEQSGIGTNFEEYANIRVFRLDVTDRQQVEEAVVAAIAAFGRIDVVMNNAGLGAYGALELASEETIDWQFAVNVRGPINVIRAFLPHFRENGGGTFINISSFMGITPAVPLGSLYAMSKFALEGLTEGLYYELKPQNIHLHLVEQGGSEDNNFVNNIQWSNAGGKIRAYDKLEAKLKHLMATAGPEQKGHPQEIVDVVYGLATGENQRFRNPVGNVAKMLLDLRGSVPIEEYLDKIAANFS